MTNGKPSVDRRQSALVLIAVSLMVAVGGWVGVGLFGYRQFFVMASQWKWRQSNAIGYWRGEILFAECGINLSTGPVGPARVRAFHPQSGLVRDTGITLPSFSGNFVANRDQFWFACPTEVVWSDGTTVTRYQPKLALAQTSTPFLLNGRLAAVAPDDNGHHRLYSFVEGEWVAGRRIAIPGPGRTWVFDPELGAERLVPRAASTAAKAVGSWEFIQAVQVGDDVHVLATSCSNTNGWENSYRAGFDFVEDSTDVASALAPENSEAEATGWYQLDSEVCQFYPALSLLDGDITFVNQWQGALWKPDPSKVGKFVRAGSFELPMQGYHHDSIRVAASLSGDDVYFVAISRLQDVRCFHRVGGQFVPVPHSLPGNAASLVSFMGTIIGLALAVLVLSHLVLLGGANRLIEREQQPQYSFGHETVTLAPLNRRFLARAIDLFILLWPFGLVGAWFLCVADIGQLLELAQTILEGVYELAVNRNWRWIGYESTVNELARFSHASEAAFGFLIATVWAIGVFVISFLIEGRTGAFVGKRLCGLRVVRTTLRPCGQARVLLRELLLCVDTANLLSPIPAVCSILSNDQRQRIGDLVADTIVVEHHSTGINERQQPDA